MELMELVVFSRERKQGARQYLKRLWRFGYLRRRRDFRGRILYRLSTKGAYWRHKYAGRKLSFRRAEFRG
jgi:hypothetical protein